MEFTEAESNLNDLVSEYQQASKSTGLCVIIGISSLAPLKPFLTYICFPPYISLLRMKYQDASAEEEAEFDEDEDAF